MGLLRRLSSFVDSLSRGVNRAAEWALFAIGISMAILMGVQVLSRYLLNHSIFWSEEVGRVCLVWITFLGASCAYKRHMHVGMDFIASRLPIAVQRGCEILVVLVSMAFFSVLVLYGFKFADFVSAQRMTAFAVSMSIPYLVIPLSGMLFFLHGLSRLLELVTTRRS